MKKTLAPSLFLLALLTGGNAMSADFSSNSIGYRYVPGESEPGVSNKVSKNILMFTHFSGDKLGTNFFTIDLLKSSSVDPANGGGTGAQEWYGLYERTFSLSALTGHTGGYGFAKDIKLLGRVDAGAKNTTFAPAPRKLRLGVAAAMPVSSGFWDVSVQAYKESNYNGIVGKSVSFSVAPALMSAWAIPVGGIATFSGFADVIGPKGKDGFGAQTKTEVLARMQVMFDVMGPKSGLKAGVGIEYWKNKFGCDNAASAIKNACSATTPMLLLEYAL